MTAHPTRAEWWREVTDPNEIIEKGRWYRMEGNDSASEYRSLYDMPRSTWRPSANVFVDSRWTPPVPPLKVGDAITTVAELIALPKGAVVIDWYKQAWQSDPRDGLWKMVDISGWSPRALIKYRGPLTILWLPEGAEQ